MCFGAGAVSGTLTPGPIARTRSRRGRRAGRMVMWVSREHGRSWQFREENRIGSNRYSKLRDDPSAWCLRPNGDETQTLRGIAKRRKRSAAKRGGTKLQHIERLRNDEAYLNALDAKRIPDPTTTGDLLSAGSAGVTSWISWMPSTAPASALVPAATCRLL